MRSLYGHTVRIFAGSFLATAVIVALTVLIQQRIEHRRVEREAATGLVASAARQARLLAPGLLVKEEYGAIDLRLKEFADSEGLARIFVAASHGDVAVDRQLCAPAADGSLTCVDAAANTVTSITPIAAGPRILGELVKIKLVPKEGWAAKLRAIALTMTGSLLCVAIALGWIWLFLMRQVRGPLLNLSSSLEPVVDGAPSRVDLSSNVEELDRLKAQIQDIIEMAEQRRAAAAVAHMVQMIAHDVRKPFTMVLSLFESLSLPANAAEAKALLTRRSQINRAYKRVDGMLKDMLSLNSKPTVKVSDVSLTTLVVDVALDVATFLDLPDLTLTLDLAHRSTVRVDGEKIWRVLLNLLTNAADATGRTGHVRVGTRSLGDGFIALEVTNSGSFIPSDRLAKIFEAFYTIGKNNGTGLGLTIAEAFVRAHGGTIACRSSQEDGTTFRLTLPAGTQVDRDLTLASTFGAAAGQDRPSGAIDAAELAPADTAEIPGDGGPEISVLIVDDEKVYGDSLISLLRKVAPMGVITCHYAKDFDEAVAAAAATAIDLAIVDIDLADKNHDGFDVVRWLKANAPRARICMHSNRDEELVGADAFSAGANDFVGKPMGRSRLQKLLGEVGRAARDRPRKRVAVVDDDPFILDMWGEGAGAATLRRFSAPEALQNAVEHEPQLLESLDCIVTDMHFDGHSLDGTALADWLRSRGFARPIYLSSETTASERDRGFSARLPKVPAEAWRLINR